MVSSIANAAVQSAQELHMQAFIQKVWNFGTKHYRNFPWRNTYNPYKILVSEVMLQQTQVARVEKHWQKFLDLFPTVDALAAAEVSLVLEAWQGLGYNRRALALKKTAEICSQTYSGKLPHSYEQLLELPGIGKASAGALMAFAYQKPTLYLETNVRAVFLHEFFPLEEAVPDTVLEPLVIKTCSSENPRGWYYALLDYGAYLKATIPNPSRKSKHYTVQSRFEGSKRQKRAELVRIVLGSSSITLTEAKQLLDNFEQAHGRAEVDQALFSALVEELSKEGFFTFDETRSILSCH